MKKIKMIALLSAGALLATALSSCSGNIAPVTLPETSPATQAAQSTGEAGRAVPGYMTGFPDYSLPENPTTDQIRQMAVKAMHDELSVHWTPASTIEYNKEGAVSEKDYSFKKGTVYGGLPYSEGSTSLFTFLHYYNFENGTLDGYNVATFNDTFGNTCANSISWGWASVIGNIPWTNTYGMTLANGCIPLGDYKMDPTLTDYRKYSTAKICKDNGDNAIFAAYALCQPADAIVTSGEDGPHARMILEKANVAYLEDGSIDPAKSTLRYQDQATGSAQEKEGGTTVYYEGHVDATATFRELLSKGYIPVTNGVFTGEIPYAAPTVSFSGNTAGSLEEFTAGKLESNFRIVAVYTTITNDSGEVLLEKTVLTTSDDVTKGTVHSFPATSFFPTGRTMSTSISDGTHCNAEIRVMIANGQIFTPCTYSFTYTK